MGPVGGPKFAIELREAVNLKQVTKLCQVIVGETESRELEMEAFVLPNQVPAICLAAKKALTMCCRQ